MENRRLAKITLSVIVLFVSSGISQPCFLGKRVATLQEVCDTNQLMAQQLATLKRLPIELNQLVDSLQKRSISFERIIVEYRFVNENMIDFCGLVLGKKPLALTKHIKLKWDEEAYLMQTEFSFYSLKIDTINRDMHSMNLKLSDSMLVSLRNVPFRSEIEELLSNDEMLRAKYPFSRPYLRMLEKGHLNDETPIKHNVITLTVINNDMVVTNYYETPFKSFGGLGNKFIDGLYSSFGKLLKRF